MSKQNCIVDGCSKQRYSADYCQSHWYSFKKYGDPLHKKRATNMLEWIRKIVQEDTPECVVWPHPVATRYKMIKFQGEYVPAHRVSLILFTGEDPKELYACHGECHNRLCINPRHLSWQTPVQNAADKYRDGTAQYGSKNPSAKLSEADIVVIRQRRQAGEVYRTIAEDYGVTITAICDACNGKSFAEVLNV